jgi:hypothetical protein
MLYWLECSCITSKGIFTTLEDLMKEFSTVACNDFKGESFLNLLDREEKSKEYDSCEWYQFEWETKFVEEDTKVLVSRFSEQQHGYSKTLVGVYGIILFEDIVK